MKESSAISYINFSPSQPHDFAVTSSAKVSIELLSVMSGFMIIYSMMY